ncbi:MAG TPA: hypothetical protein VJY40_07055, partial [Corynebacterium sp.]|nr:hypothetical protein [Corynebacterium sp.]
TVPLENGGAITFSIAGHVEAERDYDDAVVIFGRKLLKYTNSASDADRLTVRQVISSITSTPLDKVPDVGTPTPPAPVKEPAKDAPPVAAPAPVMGPAPTAAEQAAAVAQCIKPPATAPKEPAPSAPPTPEASAPAAAAAPPEGFSLCAECGEAVPANQAKLSQLFQSKTLCKKCMEAP